MPSVQQLSAGKADPFANEMANQIGQMSSSIANMIRNIRANNQAKLQNETIGKFLEYTSIGMPTEQALTRVSQQQMGFPGMLPMSLEVPTGEIQTNRTILSPSEAMTVIGKESGGKYKNNNVLAPLVAQGIIKQQYQPSRQVSNKFIKFRDEDGKVYNGVFDNDGNLVKKIGLSPSKKDNASDTETDNNVISGFEFDTLMQDKPKKVREKHWFGNDEVYGEDAYLGALTEAMAQGKTKDAFDALWDKNYKAEEGETYQKFVKRPEIEAPATEEDYNRIKSGVLYIHPVTKVIKRKK
jgi:hypothetical protein